MFAALHRVLFDSCQNMQVIINYIFMIHKKIKIDEHDLSVLS